jgi:thiosulfate/3-mercaptopyruvate sulfurtransferase
MPHTLIEPQELLAHLGDPDWAIIDCRFDLARPAWGASAWAAGHIPGALYADLDHDLAAPPGPHTGRHPLPPIEALGATFGRWGIDEQVQVIAYDQSTGVFAARLWWLLRWLGHERVAVLNGGLAAWERAGLPLTSASPPRPARTFSVRAAPPLPVQSAQVADWVAHGVFKRGEMHLIDARAADRFAGENETLDPIAGHVPGARNHPYALNLQADGRFLEARELRQRWEKTLAGAPAVRAIAMCGSGVTACHNLLALEVAGLPGARLYAGSWSEWIRDPAHAIARGP